MVGGGAAQRRVSTLSAHLTTPTTSGTATGGHHESVVVLSSDEDDNNDAVEIRYSTATDLASLALITHYGFAAQDDPAERAEAAKRRGVGDDWMMGAFNADNVAVAQVVAHPWSLGGGGDQTTCLVAAVSGVGTHIEYRRRGLLRKMMTRLFSDMVERGQAVAALWASQAAIYQRYGYTQTHHQISYTIDTVDIGFVDGDGGSCRVHKVQPDASLVAAVQPVYEQFIKGRMCAFGWGRSPGAGHIPRMLPAETRPGGAASPSPTYVALATDPEIRRETSDKDAVQGYIIYSVGWHSDGPFSRGDKPTRGQILTVHELVWLSIDAYRSIWTYIAKHDLVGEVRMKVPMDDPGPMIMCEADSMMMMIVRMLAVSGCTVCSPVE
jgi:ribosomal protein S18 acetylase RimI-like enzyme